MGVPIPKLDSVGDHSAEALLDSLKTIDPAERRKHATVFNYWLSIRSNRQFPPIRDLDPLEISDAGPWSVLLEMIGGGQDAIVKHFGQAIRDGNEVERIADASAPSLLACIHSKLPIVAACREAYAFEDRYEGDQGTVRCWVTLLPFSQNGTWIDFVYGYVSLDTGKAEATPAEAVVEEEAAAEPEPEAVEAEVEIAEVEPEPVDEGAEVAEAEPEPFTVPLAPLDEEYEESEALAEPEPETAEESVEPEPEPEMVEELVEPKPEPVEDVVEAVAEEEPVAVVEPEPEPEPEPEYEAAYEDEAPQKPGFAKFMESLGGFYGKVVQSGPDLPAESFVEEQVVDDEPEVASLPEVPAEEESPEPVVEEEQPAAELPEAQPEPAPEPAHQVEGTLQSKLTDVRAMAEEAREAQIRSNMALYEGLSAAYDFALDAEEQPEEYLRLVEAQGLKIQLRSPMKPVVKLAFDGTCDEPTIKQLEAVLGWALKQDLPRGTLAERIQAEGGIGAILEGHA